MNQFALRQQLVLSPRFKTQRDKRFEFHEKKRKKMTTFKNIFSMILSIKFLYTRTTHFTYSLYDSNKIAAH